MKSHHEHILTLPDTYIGSVEQDTLEAYIYDTNTDKIVKKNITYVPGLYKIYDEIIVNARDRTVIDKTCDLISVNIDKDEGRITVYNNGTGIPVKEHNEHKIYIPEMIFGHLLTSSNYDKKGKITGGKNGLGAKCTNIFSSEFIVETVDSENKLKFIQKYTKNMTEKEPPIIEKVSNSIVSYTRISFVPDFARFGIEGFTEDVINLFRKRVYDLAACTDNRVSVYLDNKKIEIRTFDEYILKFYEVLPSKPVYESSDRWKIGALYDPNSGFNQISYVNGICTFRGGTHVKFVLDQITDKIMELMKQKNKAVNIKPAFIKDNITIFIDCVIEDPSFDSQTKETLATKASSFNVKCSLSNNFIEKLANSGLIDEVLRFAQLKAMHELKKTDGKKTSTITGLPKLEDAKWAGGKHALECRLILTEGDSAKTFAINGLDVIGKEKFGVFPLRGKILNVRDATPKQLLGNEEIKNIKTIMGLKQGEQDISKLRYGGILILTDQDADGAHIKGLLINLFHVFWPELVKNHGFIQTINTPILKVFKCSDIKKKQPLMTFYTIADYNLWRESHPGKFYIKYYKGLGTSTGTEARESFQNFDDKLITYTWEEKEENEPDKNINAITLAFSKERANDRKFWLREHKINYLSKEKNITFTQFIDNELRVFSLEDNMRSIPGFDGFKPSQRKILFECLRNKKLEKEDKKVSELAADVSGNTSYHHGQISLEEAIVKLAQNYVGSNNINLLEPNGEFGTRYEGGTDCSSSRYIFTQLNEITTKIFRREDIPIYKYLEDEGKIVEPELYAPIIPMVLVNGVRGIGTGYSTNIPCYNPKEIIGNILRMLKNENPIELMPWYHGFTGKIIKNGKNYLTVGKYEILDNRSVRITELPIGTWTLDYKIFLESLIVNKQSDGDNEGKILTGYDNNSNNIYVDFTLEFFGNALQHLLKNDSLEKKLKLTSSISISNMHLYNVDKVITKYENVCDIFYEFFKYRLQVYEIRKAYYVKLLEHKMNILKYKKMFIDMYYSHEIIIENKTEEEVIIQLKHYNIPELSDDLNDETEKSYKYITSMPLFSLTKDKIKKLEEELKKRKDDLDSYVNTSIEDLWKMELAELLDSYDKYTKERNETYTVQTLKKHSKK